MPGSVEITTTHPSGEIPAVNATVFVGDNQQNATDYVTVMSVTQSMGIVPATATLRVTTGRDVANRNTLRVINIKHGTRISISVRCGDTDVVVFLGQIMTRRDQGATGNVIYTAIDDRMLLSKIPVRGCMVRDGEAVKFISRYTPRVNPDGRWNCIGARMTVNGVDDIYPVFSQTAILGKSYQSPDEAFEVDLQEGVITAWTPRRFLRYLNMIANVRYQDPGSEPDDTIIEGVRINHWRSIRGNRPRIAWEADTVKGMRGTDLVDETLPDPLDRKMPDMNFQGVALALAIKNTLSTAGTHEMVLSLSQTESTTAAEKISYIQFVPIGYSVISGGYLGESVIVGGSGDVRDHPTSVYDFDLYEDASRTDPCVLVEGAPVTVETSVEYSGAVKTLKPGWTQAEEDIFLAMIRGDETQYAKLPQYQGDTTVENLILADGTGDAPEIPYISDEAVRMARQCFPNVFRAFYIDSSASPLSSAFDGVNDEYAAETEYPVLKGGTGKNKAFRPIAATQEQFVTTNLTGSDDESSRLVTKYPVRIRTRSGFGEWYESAYTSGLRVTPDGLIWLDGLGENIDGAAGCLYSGTIKSVDNDGVELKDIKINCVMPMDHNTIGYKQDVQSELDEGYANDALGGLPLMYINSPGAYKEIHQVNSSPAHTLQFREDDGTGEEGTTAAPLNRYLPPGSEAIHAEYAAQRKLQYSKNIYRKTSYKYPGIRTEHKPGEWVYLIERRDASGNTLEYYRIAAPVESVTYDFSKQETQVGGLVSTII